MSDIEQRISQLFNINENDIVGRNKFSVIAEVADVWLRSGGDQLKEEWSHGNSEKSKGGEQHRSSEKSKGEEQHGSSENKTEVVITELNAENINLRFKKTMNEEFGKYKNSLISTLTYVGQRNRDLLHKDAVLSLNGYYCLEKGDENLGPAPETNFQDLKTVLTEIHGIKIITIHNIEGRSSTEPEKSDDQLPTIDESIQREVGFDVKGESAIECQDHDDEGHSATNNQSHDLIPDLYLSSATPHSNLKSALSAFASLDRGTLYILSQKVSHSVQNALTFSPAVLQLSSIKPLFILYQVLQLFNHFEKKYSLNMKAVHWDDVELDTRSWIRVDLSDTFADSSSVDSKKPEKLKQAKEKRKGNSDRMDQLPTMLDKWVSREVSNYDYLMFLNELSGRSRDDPNHHPVLPWVSSLETENDSWRDLTKSKYRLNKGDDQLDLQYSMMKESSIPHDGRHRSNSINLAQVPHHVPEFLSDITYYVYMARQTSQEILCKLVRSYWEPNEYPASIQRMQAWTPDECIPELYTDPTVFKSVHDDMSDLAVPDWCSDVEDFLKKHRAMLESDFVSQQLHHWIDITFGYKLQGKDAINAKNVCLPLVDMHTKQTSRGIAQLFHVPHPQKRCQNKNISFEKNLDLGFIEGHSQLPAEYDPLQELDQLEKLFTFKAQMWNSLEMTSSLSNAVTEAQHEITSRAQNELLLSDINVATYICLIIELYLSSKIRTKTKNIPLSERFEICIECFKLHQNQLSFSILHSIRYFIDNLKCCEAEFLSRLDQSPSSCIDYTSIFATISDRGLPPPTPDLLLSPYIHVMPFPSYFAKLYDVIDYLLIRTDHYSKSLDESASDELTGNLRELLDSLHDTTECLELLIPHVQQILQQLTPCSAYFLIKNFETISKATGPKLFMEKLFPSVLNLYSMIQDDSDEDFMSSSWLQQMYEESFLLQLNTRLGILNFLQNIPRCLADALISKRQSEEDEASTKSIHWLMKKIGPTLTSKYIVRHLFRVLNQCFLLDTDHPQQKEVLNCLMYAASLFGTSIITLQYIAHLTYTVSSAVKSTKFTLREQSALEASVVAATHFIPYFDDATLMEQLKRISNEIIIPIIKLLGRKEISFHGGSSRRKNLCLKIIHLMALIVIRIGREMSRTHLTRLFQTFFSYFGDKKNSSTGVQSSMKSHWLNVTEELADSSAVIIHRDDDTQTYKVGDTVVLQNVEDNVKQHLHMSWLNDSPSQGRKKKLMKPSSGERSDSCPSLVPPSDPNQEICSTFCPETAYCAYVSFSRMLGNIHMENILSGTHEYIWKLSLQHEHVLNQGKDRTAATTRMTSTPYKSHDTPDITMVGNRLIVATPPDREKVSNEEEFDIMTTLLTSSGGIRTEDHLEESARRTLKLNGSSQLTENWLAYWEHEIGLSDVDKHIHFNQIELQTFSGHNNAVKCLSIDQSEEWFLSGGRDKTVKIWSLSNRMEALVKKDSSCQPCFTYKGHKKSIHYVGIVESEQLILSNDGTMHVWDPFTGQQILCFDSQDVKSGIAAVATLPAPQRLAVAITNETNMKIIDFRRKILAQEYRTSPSTSVGIVRSLCVDTDGVWAAIGFSSGVVSVLDIRMGIMMSVRKQTPDTDIVAMCSVSNRQFLTAASDQTVSLWEIGSSVPSVVYRSYQEPVHVINMFNDEIVAASTANRVTVHRLLPEEKITEGDIKFIDTPVTEPSKLRSDCFKGVLTTFCVLPMKRQLLFASDNGNIKLLA